MTNNQTKMSFDERISPFREYIYMIGVFSFFFNLLMLTPPLYMRTVFDYAMGHRSQSTLFALTVLMIFLLIGLGFLGWARTQLAQRAGVKLFSLLADEIFEVGYKRSVYAPASEASVDKLQELSKLKDFIGGSTFCALFDVFFTPIFIAVMFFFHLYLGILGVVALIILVFLNLLNERMNSETVASAARLEKQSLSFARSNYQRSESIDAMGIVTKVEDMWGDRVGDALRFKLSAASMQGALSTISSTYRIMISSLTLGFGAYLAINNEISMGVVVAASILLSRALSPVDTLVGNWGSVVTARACYTGIRGLFDSMPAKIERVKLPRPLGALSVEKVILAVPGTSKPIIRGVSFSVKSGGHLGIVGPSGSGKSTLARALIGLWPCTKGAVRLDGSDIFQWDRKDLGPSIGYLPQNVEIFDASVGDNIGRLGDWDAESVVEAAKLAGVHDMILRLPQGYDTKLGPGSTLLSGGQMQGIVLARALYGNPVYVVLDEPSTNLDSVGQQALLACVNRLKALGVTLIIISHDIDLLGALDSILVLTAGQVTDFGTPEKILSSYLSVDHLDKPTTLSENGAPDAPSEP